MNIGGFQKISLLDYPGKISSIIFTQGCLFRCSYCHNPELISIQKAGQIHERQILDCLKERKNFIDGVCITGGEPTLQADLQTFIQKVKDIGLFVKLDTSGVNPRAVEKLLAKNLLDYIAMDIKNTWDGYQKVVQVSNQRAIQNCQETFALIQQSGVDHEFRTTVFPHVHTEQDFFAIAGYLKPKETYAIQDIRYEKTLDPKIDRSKHIDVAALAKNLQKAYPEILIQVR